MAQPWPASWRVYTKNGVPVEDPVDKKKPPGIDIVGNQTFPAVYFQFDGTSIFFRIRLNGNPVSGGSLIDYNWGVLFDTDLNPETYEWLITVNGEDNTIELWKNWIKWPINSFKDAAEGHFYNPNYSEPIVLGSNVRVVPAGDGSNFEGNPDFFLDFQISWTTFSSLLGINEFTSMRLLYYTSTSNRKANKDRMGGHPRTLCQGFGDIITPDPADPQVGELNVTKVITDGPLQTTVNTVNTWRVEIHVDNIGSGPVDNVIMTDQIFLDTISNVNIISVSKGSASQAGSSIQWNIGTLAAGENTLLVAEITGSFAAEGTAALDEATVTGIEPVLGPISAGPSTGAGIEVLPDPHPPVPVLDVEKFLSGGPTSITVNTTAAWLYTIRAENTGTGSLDDIIITDAILLDQITNLRTISVSKGSISINSGIFTWDIGTLAPGEVELATFEVIGSFSATGESKLNRTIAIGTDPATGEVIQSNPVSGISIDVTPAPLPAVLEMVKRILTGPKILLVDQEGTWTVELIVTNTGDSPANSV